MEIITNEIIKIIFSKGKENSDGKAIILNKTEIFIKEILSKENLMVSGNISGKTVKFMKEIMKMA